MINFIICDDNKNYLNKVKNVVDKFMMKNHLEYKTHLFTDYNNDFIEKVNEKLSFKIYILDIETPTRSGIDVARIIRLHDVNSVIIFLTGHEELGNVVNKDNFSFLTFINKFDNCEERLSKSLIEALKHLKTRPKIKIKDNGVVYSIALDDILYIAKDSVDRKCIVKTDNLELKIGKTLNSMQELLNGNFVQTHRSCIVNTNRIIAINKSKRIITFDNGEIIDLLSDKYIKELV